MCTCCNPCKYIQHSGIHFSGISLSGNRETLFKSHLFCNHWINLIDGFLVSIEQFQKACLKWMVEGIARGFDCNAYGCFTPGGQLVSGFTCSKTPGIHLRDDVYGIDIVNQDEAGLGDMVLVTKENPELRYPVGEKAKLVYHSCDVSDQHLVDTQPGEASDLELDAITQSLINWTSVLDCRVRRSTYGVELELVVFPGEKLPKLPSAARQIVRPWDPDKDEPFYYTPGIEKKLIFLKND